MVAIVTGNGLGVERSSAFVLRSNGQVGNAAFGTGGENVTVNARNTVPTAAIPMPCSMITDQQLGR